MADHVLVTGGAGFIGRHLCADLLEAGCRVTVIDDLSRQDHDGGSDGARLVRADLTRPVDPAIVGDVSTVYHLAAVVGVEQANGSPSHMLTTNLLVTLNTVELCRSLRPDTVFMASTSELNDGAATLGLAAVPVPEHAPFALAEPAAPRSSYAVSKLASELLVRYLADDLGTRVRIARFHNVYGPDMGHRHVIPQFIDRVIRRVDPFPIFGATQTRAYCHVSDAVRAARLLTDLDTAEVVLANVGNDEEEVTAGELAQRLYDIAGWQPSMEHHPAPAGSPDRRCPDLTVLRALTGYRPTVALTDGLRATYEAACAVAV